MTATKAIIFDLGKVVFDLSFDRVFQNWANTSGQSFEEIKSRFVFDEVFDRFEKNEISPDQFRAAISQRLNIHLSDEDFDNGWCDLYLGTYAGIDNLLISLKRKYRLVALTNTNAIHYKVWPTKYAETLSHFEKIFSSHELMTRKPEAKIFEMVLEYLNMEPGQTLFLDDNTDNINGAENLGIPALLVTSQEQMRTILSQLDS
jgi:epoxide hydrolase-like predicted phosphatase